MERNIKHWTHTEDKTEYHGEFRSIDSAVEAAKCWYSEGDSFFICSVHRREISDFLNVENLVEDLKCQALDEVGHLDHWLHDLKEPETFDLNSMISKTLKNWARQHGRECHLLGTREVGRYLIKDGAAVLAGTADPESLSVH